MDFMETVLRATDIEYHSLCRVFDLLVNKYRTIYTLHTL